MTCGSDLAYYLKYALCEQRERADRLQQELGMARADAEREYDLAKFLTEANHAYEHEVERLQRENERLREALSWYAEELNGKRARKALDQ